MGSSRDIHLQTPVTLLFIQAHCGHGWWELLAQRSEQKFISNQNLPQDVQHNAECHMATVCECNLMAYVISNGVFLAGCKQLELTVCIGNPLPWGIKVNSWHSHGMVACEYSTLMILSHCYHKDCEFNL